MVGDSKAMSARSPRKPIWEREAEEAAKAKAKAPVKSDVRTHGAMLANAGKYTHHKPDVLSQFMALKANVQKLERQLKRAEEAMDPKAALLMQKRDAKVLQLQLLGARLAKQQELAPAISKRYHGG